MLNFVEFLKYVPTLDNVFEKISDIANYNNNCKHVKVFLRQRNGCTALIFGT